MEKTTIKIHWKMENVTDKRIFYKGDVVKYIGKEGVETLGVIVSNNLCLFHSKVFQVVPINDPSEANIQDEVKNEDLISRSWIIEFVGRVDRGTLRRLDNAIIKHHEVKGMGEYQIGDVYMANIPEYEDSSIQKGFRPVIVVSGEENEEENFHVLPLTTKDKKKMRTHVKVSASDTFMERDSIIMAESEMTLPKMNLIKKIGTFDEAIQGLVLNAIKVQHQISIC